MPHIINQNNYRNIIFNNKNLVMESTKKEKPQKKQPIPAAKKALES